MSRNDLETPWDGCPKCGEYARFKFLVQRCEECEWSLRGPSEDETSDVPTWVQLTVLAAALVGGLSMVFAGGAIFAKHFLSVPVPGLSIWLALATALSSLGGAATLSHTYYGNGGETA